MIVFRSVAVLMLVLTVPVSAQTVSYEGTSFPEQLGWERVGSFDADRWIQDGWFSQYVELGVWEPPPIGELDSYRRSVSDFAGHEEFFIEWRVETDAPSSDLDVSGTPVVLSAFGRGNANYHFTITDEKVRVIRSTTLPIVFVDIEAGLPHTYRLELFWDERYIWYIDGALIDSGVPYGVYPRDDSKIIWGAQYYLNEHMARWDYIRFGVIPVDGSGDYDSDAQVTLDDFYFVHECLTNERPGINGGPGNDAGPGCRFADFDFDTDVDLLDVAEFQAAFTGGE